MYVFELLKKDHRSVEELIDSKLQNEGYDYDLATVTKICEELRTHMDLEEDILYPTLEEYEGFEEDMEDSFNEHERIRDLLKILEQTSEEKALKSLLTELRERVEQHVQDEEQRIFPKAEKIVGKKVLQEISEECTQLKQEKARHMSQAR